MDTVCSECGYVIKNYKNIYGTRCRRCNAFIKPEKKPRFIIENKEKIKLLQQEMRNKLKKKIGEIKNAYFRR